MDILITDTTLSARIKGFCKRTKIRTLEELKESLGKPRSVVYTRKGLGEVSLSEIRDYREED